MSRYVQRCETCRRVLGVSSFRVQRTGGRAESCLWCERNAPTGREMDLDALERQRNVLYSRRRSIDQQIVAINRKLARARAWLAADEARRLA